MAIVDVVQGWASVVKMFHGLVKCGTMAIGRRSMRVPGLSGVRVGSSEVVVVVEDCRASSGCRAV